MLSGVGDFDHDALRPAVFDTGSREGAKIVGIQAETGEDIWRHRALDITHVSPVLDSQALHNAGLRVPSQQMVCSRVC